MLRKLALIVGGLAAAGTATALLAQDPAAVPGKALFETKCHTCHELDVITVQRLSGADWSGVVHRMIDANGAQLTEPEAQEIIAYLTVTYGNGAPPPAGAGQQAAAH